ncbi:MAG: hypothetical protein LBG64_01325 [Pseudomonadales bacterium]|jgi:hypothetical protein|nr:hypothetical protein [Pseudomonadales bacterium]
MLLMEIHSNSQPIPQPQKRKKKWVGKVILLLILLGIIFLVFRFFINPLLERRRFEHDLANFERFMAPTSFDLIEQDFYDGLIDADTYVRQMIYLAFATDRLDPRYESDSSAPIPFFHITEIAEPHQYELSEETLLLLLDIFMPEVNFDQNSNANLINSSRFIPTAKAATATNVADLTRVILSPDGNFLVFYSHQGEDRVSDQNAQRVADKLAEDVISFREQFGLDFGWQPTHVAGQNQSLRAKINLVSSQLGITEAEATQLVDSAMPIYLMNSRGETGNVWAVHINITSDLGWILQQLQRVAFTPEGRTPVFPTIIIFPHVAITDDLAELDFIVTHELVHTYQFSYCRDNDILNDRGSGCPSGLFTQETWANMVGAKFLDTSVPVRTRGIFQENIGDGTIFNRWATRYAVNSDRPLYDSFFRGYAQMGFAQTYIEHVPNGAGVFWQALQLPSNDSSIRFLVEQADSHWTNVMMTLAGRLITNDWGNHAFNSLYLPPARRQLCTNDCRFFESIPNTAIHYFYIDPTDFNPDFRFRIDFSVVGSEENLGLILFGGREREPGLAGRLLGRFVSLESRGYDYTVITSSMGELSFSPSDFSQYDQLIVGVVGTSTFGVGNPEILASRTNYIVEVVNEDLEELLGRIRDFDFENFPIQFDGNCLYMDFQNMGDAARQIAGLIRDINLHAAHAFNYEIGQIEIEGQFDSAGAEQLVRSQLNLITTMVDLLLFSSGRVADEIEEFGHQTDYVAQYTDRVMVCISYIDGDYSNEELHDRLPALLGMGRFRVGPITYQEGEIKIQIVSGVSLSGISNSYALVTNTETGERMLFSMEIQHTQDYWQHIRPRF